MNVAFTIVLNGMPFIRQQMEIIPKIFDHWYIVEGVALPVKDTSWCRAPSSEFHDENYLSIDGTKEYLDSIQADKVTVIRNNNQPWNGKVDMCNSFMDKLPENTTLMQFDADEIWNEDTLNRMLIFCQGIDSDLAMRFRCNYFVGPDIKILSQDTYGDMPYEWYRLWKFKKPGVRWVAHEPPTLDRQFVVLDKNFTASKGWVFEHHAYVYAHQVAFKENYYGYAGAVESWKKLQEHKEFPCLLRDHLPWVQDNAIVDKSYVR
jgi:hypothetical protein